MPRKPDAPDMPESPEVDGYCGGGYPVVGRAMHIWPGPYLSGWHGDRWAFWLGLWDTDISYSWSGNSGGGELTYWNYRYHYSWAGNSADNDASGCDPTLSAVESDPKTQGNYTLYGDEDFRPPVDSPVQASDTNELPLDAPVLGPEEKPKPKAAKGG